MINLSVDNYIFVYCQRLSWSSLSA